MVKPLTGQDAFFIYAETPVQHQHTLAMIILDPSTAPPGRFSIEGLMEVMHNSLRVMPEYRMKLVDVPLTVSPPALINDPDFDFDNHVKHVSLPKPGSMKQLCKLVDKISSRPLDKSKPLWEVIYISGLEGGRVAVINKSHHCIADGSKASKMLAEQMDLEPDPPEQEDIPVEPWKPEPVPIWDVTVQTWRSQMKDRQGFGKMLNKTFKAISKRRQVTKDRPQSEEAVPALFPKAPRLKFNGEINGDRTVAVGRLPLADVKHVKNHFGVKLNDVALAIFSMAMRDYLISTNDLPDDPLVISIPVSLTLRGQNKTGKSNANGSMQVKLPVADLKPKELLEQVHEYTVEAKHIFENSFEDLMNGYVSMLPPLLAKGMLSALFGKTAGRYMPTPTNGVVSNVPGPPIPLYMKGAVVDGVYPIGPVMGLQGMNVTLMSVNDHLDFTVHVCKKNLKDAWPIAEGMERALKVLMAATKTRKPARKAAAKKPVKKKAVQKKAAAKKKTTPKKKPTVKKAKRS